MFKKLVLLVTLLFTGVTVQAEYNIKFEPVPKVQEVAEAFNLDCIDYVKSQFKIELDGSDSSIKHIEGILDSLSNHVKTNGMPEERISDFSKIFGFYIGETYRKNHGGVDWGFVFIDGSRYYGLGDSKTGKAFIWPIANVLKRIHLGPEANIEVYYSAITKK